MLDIHRACLSLVQNLRYLAVETQLWKVQSPRSVGTTFLHWQGGSHHHRPGRINQSAFLRFRPCHWPTICVESQPTSKPGLANTKYYILSAFTKLKKNHLVWVTDQWHLIGKFVGLFSHFSIGKGDLKHSGTQGTLIWPSFSCPFTCYDPFCFER